MAFLRISIGMKRLNPKTGKPFKCGFIREDGLLFYIYGTGAPKRKDGTFTEIWLTQEAFDKRRAQSVKTTQEWRANNPEKSKQSGTVWRQNNPHKLNSYNGKRRAAKLLRTPKWLTADDLFMIEEAYHLAKLRTELTGISWHVDHILPLQGRKVSGLHVPANLQVIPATINLKKSNRHE